MNLLLIECVFLVYNNSASRPPSRTDIEFCVQKYYWVEHAGQIEQAAGEGGQRGLQGGGRHGSLVQQRGGGHELEQRARLHLGAIGSLSHYPGLDTTDIT